MITILTARGIGERLADPRQMCKHVTQYLDPKRYRVSELRADVLYGPVGVAGLDGASFATTLRAAHDEVLDEIDLDPYPVILLGYSGGAALMGNVAAEIGAGQHPHLDVRGVALIADPNQPVGISAHGHGVAGPRDITGIPAWWAYSDLDPICVTPTLSPLRTLADQSAAMSLADPMTWLLDVHRRLTRGDWQPSAIDLQDPLGTMRRYAEAFAATGRYLTHHTAAYPGSRTAELAHQIMAGVRR